jgi:hypothetical protein
MDWADILTMFFKWLAQPKRWLVGLLTVMLGWSLIPLLTQLNTNFFLLWAPWWFLLFSLVLTIKLLKNNIKEMKK